MLRIETRVSVPVAVRGKIASASECSANGGRSEAAMSNANALHAVF
jgi:hypothetical protein